MNRSTRWKPTTAPWIGWAALVGLWTHNGPVHAGTETTEPQSFSLFAGWNFTRLPEAWVHGVPSSVQDHPLYVFATDSEEGALSSWSELAVDAIGRTSDPKETYWIWSGKPLDIEVETFREATPRISSSHTEGWGLLNVTQEVVYDDSNAASVFRWDPARQIYVRLPPHDRSETPFNAVAQGQNSDEDFASRARLIAASARGNYQEAILLLETLLTQSVDESTQEERFYQVEYLADGFDTQSDSEEHLPAGPSLSATPKHRDATHLAGFERVWAYTQGIALATLSRKAHIYAVEAQGLARTICHHAIRDPQTNTILGWPFSWNTKDDSWKDRRLVTGANAWVVHGLGAFLASDVLKSTDEGWTAIKNCYQDALLGLQTHRNEVLTQDGKTVTLMSAGWTAQGLKQVQTPWQIKTNLGEPFVEGGRLAYYSVLDAIGYDHFSATHIKSCTPSPGLDCRTIGPQDPAWQRTPIEDKETWQALRRRVRAENIVTEHNIDVLSVLNQALRHPEVLGPEDRDARKEWGTELEAWRDQVRDGIFFALWDDQGWKKDLEHTLHKANRPPKGLTEDQTRLFEAQERRLQEALDSGDLGRVVTGGTLKRSPSGTLRLVPSPHSAIDNCSWLAIAVDHRNPNTTTPNGRSAYTERLAKCLEYTVLQFAKDLPVQADTCQPQNTPCVLETSYRGAHYFQNSFRDLYIEPSARQESSYHLEATMGLILGLFTFAHAHPERPESAILREDALGLWAGAQDFIRDHGFPYSSQRIQDLSTQLESSTAAIWFIDVYDDLNKRLPAGDLIDLDAHVDPTSPEWISLVDRLNLVSSEIAVEQGEPLLTQLGPRTVLINGKARTKATQAVVKLVDELLGVPAPLAAAALGSMAGAGHILSGFTEVDAGLETLFLGGDQPPGEDWERVGFVVADDVLAPPLGTYLKNETEIRATTPLYPESPSLSSQRESPTFFDDNRIYSFQVDRLGVDESPLGDVRLLTPKNGAVWPVYALKSHYPRHEILQAYIHTHPRWERAKDAVAWLPPVLQSLWFSLVEISIRAEFGQSDAQEFATDQATPHRAGDMGLLTTPGFQHDADGIPRPIIDEIYWKQNKSGAQFVVEFGPGSYSEYGKIYARAVIECSYKKKDLPKTPEHKQHPGNIRKEATLKVTNYGHIPPLAGRPKLGARETAPTTQRRGAPRPISTVTASNFPQETTISTADCGSEISKVNGPNTPTSLFALGATGHQTSVRRTWFPPSTFL